MSQRNSGRARIARDAYNTPEWVTHVLVDDLEREGLLPLYAPCAGAERAPEARAKRVPRAIWEPAAGTGQMSGVLAARGYEVYASDVHGCDTTTTCDFLAHTIWPTDDLPAGVGAIITNPPYNLAEKFVARALELTEANGHGGLVAMLLKSDWDSAGTRRRFFADHPAWRRKIVLNDRIFWIEPEDGKGGPSENHAWFVWQWRGRNNDLAAEIGYAAMPADDKRALKARLAARRKAAKAHKAAMAGAAGLDLREGERGQ